MVLYNNYHNGDVFYSRMLCQIILENGYEDIIYYHKNKNLLFEDLPQVQETDDVAKMNNQSKKIDTWIGSRMYHKGDRNTPNGCSFLNHFRLIQDVAKQLDIKLDKKYEDYLPIVNFDKLKTHSQIDRQMKNFKKRFCNLVLICDGDTLSRQAINFDFKNIIVNLSNIFPKTLFITTNSEINDVKNIKSVFPDITERQKNLLDISYISTYCNIIVGRSSGPFCFTHLRENFLDPKKTFISFSKNETEGKFYLESKSKQIWSDTYDTNKITEIIKSEINENG